MKLVTGIIAILFLSLSGLNNLNGQFYSTGEPPASIRFSEIKTQHFKLVFPDSIKPLACKLANQMEFYLPMVMKDMNRPFNKKLPVLLHSTSVFSNGYVTLAPERMELVVTPPRDLYPQDWITQLSIHELRHFVQMNYLRQGFSKWLGFAFGEIGPGLVSAEIPKWYYEGDAVYFETLLSQSGRGRIPGFDMPLRTQLLESKHHFSYDKSLLGSYKDYVPDHYQTGFHLVNYARIHFDSLVWPNVLRFTAKYPFTVWPVAFYLKKNFGLNKAGLYNHSMDTLKALYIKQLNKVNYRSYKGLIGRNDSVFTNYKSPVTAGNKIIALRSGLKDPGSLVEINAQGHVHKIKTLGYTDELEIDAYQNSIIWNELQKDPRWDQRSYSVLKTYDLKTLKTKRITRKTRYFNPKFSPDGQKILVVEEDERGKNYITILDDKAHVLQKVEASSETFQSPSWVNNNEVVLISVTSSGKQMKLLNLSDESWQILIKETSFDISQPVSIGDYIVFRSSYNGIENLYAIKRSDPNDIRQVTYSGKGAFFPYYSDDRSLLFFSEYTQHGFTVCETPFKPEQLLKTNLPGEASLTPDFYSKSLPTGRYAANDSFSVKQYNRITHLFNVHSWIPFYTDLDQLRENASDLPIQPGVTLFSQNLLSTFISSIGYRYDHGYHEVIPSFTWRGLYPVITFSGQIGGPQMNLNFPDEVKPEFRTYYEWNAKVYIPWLFYRGKYTTLIRPEVEYTRSSIAYYNNNSIRRGIDFVDCKGYLFNHLRMAPRDIYPRWGQSMIASYVFTPSDKGLFGNMYSLETDFYFPGLFSQHSLYIKAGLQRQHLRKYYVPLNRLGFPRGYKEQYSEYLTSVNFNYALPLFYPDLGVRPLFYVKRLRADLFYDWCFGTHLSNNVKANDDFQSMGIELVTDLNFFRIIFPFSTGVRMGYLPEKNSFFSEFIFGINLGS